MEKNTPYNGSVRSEGCGIGQIATEDRYRIIAESTYEWEFWRGPDGHFEFMSPSCECVSGYPPEAFYEHPELYTEIIHPEDRHLFENHQCAPFNLHNPSIEYRIIRKDGQVRWIDHVCHAIFDEQHHPLGCRASNRDITEKKLAQEELDKRTAEAEESRLMLNAILRYIPTGIVVADAPDARIRLVNAYSCELMGLPAEEMMSSLEKYRVYRPGETDPAPHESLPLVRAIQFGEKVKNEEWIVEKPDGTRLPVLCNAEPICDDQGRITGGILVWQDITERREYEDELEHSRGKLTELKDQLLEKNKEMESLISVISHDLRSPLVSVNGFSREVALSCKDLQEALSEVSLPPPQADTINSILNEAIPEYLGYIEMSAEAMDQLVRSLIKVTRAGLARIEPERLDMNALVATAAASMEFEMRKSKVELIIDTLPECFADKTQISQVFANLLDNAVKYLEPSRRGRIHVYGQSIEGMSVYCVEDNGIGIAAEYQHAVFDLFSRIQRHDIGGEGIGLAVVKRLIDNNNGTIRLESQPGSGSKFCITLPQV